MGEWREAIWPRQRSRIVGILAFKSKPRSRAVWSIIEMQQKNLCMEVSVHLRRPIARSQCIQKQGVRELIPCACAHTYLSPPLQAKMLCSPFAHKTLWPASLQLSLEGSTCRDWGLTLCHSSGPISHSSQTHSSLVQETTIMSIHGLGGSESF